jgi:hypothetical protein
LLCDTILKEFEALANLSQRLESDLVLHKGNNFAASIRHNRPEFNAARFVSIDRSIIFSILNAVTTVALVIIQFKPHILVEN